MKNQESRYSTHRPTGLASSRNLLIGLAGGLAAVAWLSTRSRQAPQRRHADRGQERRNPMHFFLAGTYPRRRALDRTGQRPLFERRQSVYEAY